MYLQRIKKKKQSVPIEGKKKLGVLIMYFALGIYQHSVNIIHIFPVQGYIIDTMPKKKWLKNSS